MQSIRNFFRLVWRCALSVDVFPELLSKRVMQGATYLYFLFLLTTCLSVVPSIVKAPTFFNVPSSITEGLADVFQNVYPPELEIVVERGELRANVPQPYYIPVSPELRKWLDAKFPQSDAHTRNAKNLIEIDTNAGADDYLKRESLVLVTKHYLVLPDREAGFEVKKFASDENFVLNKAEFDKYFPMLKYLMGILPWLIWLMSPLFLIAVLIFVPAVMVGWYLCYLLIPCVFLLILATVLRLKISFGEIFVVSIYGLTLPVIIKSIWEYAIPFPIFLFSIIFLGWMSVVFVSLARGSRSANT